MPGGPHGEASSVQKRVPSVEITAENACGDNSAFHLDAATATLPWPFTATEG
jgi:hypothetical protein